MFIKSRVVRVPAAIIVGMDISMATLTALDLINNPVPGRLLDSLIVIGISFVSALGAEKEFETVQVSRRA